MYASDLKHPVQTLEDKLHQLYTLNRDKTIDLGFRPPYLKLLEAFDNPHLNLPPIIHVAGTNGKGSIIAMLRAMLEAEGYKVHAYTSPHLERFNERIVLAGQEIEDGPLEDLIDEALAHNEGGDVTFFEITTAMAFAAFSRVPADICLLETGLGGRLDCTNVIEKPLATVISAIGFDHQEFLGESLPQIAAEKAGIMKDHAACIIGAQNRSANIMPVFETKAAERNATLYACDADWIIEPFDDTKMRFIYRGEEMLLPRPALEGLHQIQNAGAALATLKTIKERIPVSENAACKGLKNIQWRARCQHLSCGALVDQLPPGWSLYLDGGHNEGAGQALGKIFQDWGKENIHLIIGMMQGKDAKAFLSPMMPHAASLSFIPIPNEPQAMSYEALKEQLPDTNIISHPTLAQAIQEITTSHKPGRIVICGSLYLAGHVLSELSLHRASKAA